MKRHRRPPRIVVNPSAPGVLASLAGVWRTRQLLGVLVRRDLKLRYQQTVVGATWVLVQPVLTVAVFSVIFGGFAALPSDGVPYELFALAGLLPWLYVSQSMAVGATSLVADQVLVTKMYFPRLVLPLSRVVRALVDLGVAALLLVGMMVWFSIEPSWRLAVLPAVILFATATSLALAAWLAPLNVRYRDIGNALPSLLQLWLFMSPIAYPVSLVPPDFRSLYALNPLVGVIESFRWCLLGTEPDMSMIWLGAIVTTVMLVSGLTYFASSERWVADVI